MEIYLRGCCLCSDPTRMASILSSNLLSGPDDQNLKGKKRKNGDKKLFFSERRQDHRRFRQERTGNRDI